MEVLKHKSPHLQTLAPILEDLFSRFHSRQYFSLDPIEFVYRYEHPEDQEVIAILAGTLAYGKVEQIRKSVQKLIELFTPFSSKPSEWLSVKSPEQKLLSTFKHRFNVGNDVISLLQGLSKIKGTQKSVGHVFESMVLHTDQSIERPLSKLIFEIKKTSPRSGSSFRYLLTSPADGSACKRWLMILRWMVRKDLIDLGIWQSARLSPAQLVFPLDTHTFELGKNLGLIKRSSADWKAALEMTESLKKFDPTDPVRFDFAFCRSGMLDFRSALVKK